MGALHAGHISLLRLARSATDIVGATIFVNPTQFAAHEDFGAYPRGEDRDIALLAEAGCDFVYCPSPGEIYPPGDTTRVRVGALCDDLEGAIRPHFFEGVASVVARLFLHLSPDVAAFGEKDYQQLLVIRALTRDLGFPIRILGGETAREADGLALSSRNAYLSPDERARAGALPAALRAAIEAIECGASLAGACAEARSLLLAGGFSQVDYVEARRADTLSSFPDDAAPCGVAGRLLAAARIGTTRLIDNMPFERSGPVTRP
jgi:pantoate--beta-alanine ligase